MLREFGDNYNLTIITELASDNAVYYDWNINYIYSGQLYCKLTIISICGKILLYYMIKDKSSGLPFTHKSIYPWEDGDSPTLKLFLKEIKAILHKD